MDIGLLTRVIIALLIAVVLIPLYILPTILGRNKRNKIAIIALNLLLGWTVIGWIAVLIWAVRADETVAAPPQMSVRAVLPQYCSMCQSYSMPCSSICRNCGRTLRGLGMQNG